MGKNIEEMSLAELQKHARDLELENKIMSDRETNRREQERINRTRAQVKFMSDAINSSNFDWQGFCNEMAREHRYLQSEWTLLCMRWLKTCASDEYQTDDRNNWCKALGRDLIAKGLI
jgi:hypothetical protein